MKRYRADEAIVGDIDRDRISYIQELFKKRTNSTNPSILSPIPTQYSRLPGPNGIVNLRQSDPFSLSSQFPRYGPFNPTSQSSRRSDSSKFTPLSPTPTQIPFSGSNVDLDPRISHSFNLPSSSLSPTSTVIPGSGVDSFSREDFLQSIFQPPLKKSDNIEDYFEKQRLSVPSSKRQKLTNDCPGQERYKVASVAKDVCKITQANTNEYKRLCQQFLSAWVKGDPPPLESISVYMITNTALKRRWQAYKDQLSDTTIETHYHGTKLCCDISSLQLCNNKLCGICGITQNSFDRSLIGSNISRFKRFGDAFYLAPNSSKCHDYTVGYGQYRAMLCFRVLPGHKCTLKKTNVNFVLPQGYDSGYGEPGESLNYPELLLYKSEAALPVCIFMYKKDGIAKIAK